MFSAAAVARVPYFASIVPHVVRMEPGLAEMAMGHRPAHPADFNTIAEGTDIVVPVCVTDRDGVEVVHAGITTWVTRA